MLQPQCSYELQQWRKGFYTLLRDDHMSNKYALDAIIYFNAHSMKQLQGGFVSYIARDADEEVSLYLFDPPVLMYMHEA
jgi:hypothetical protein